MSLPRNKWNRHTKFLGFSDESYTVFQHAFLTAADKHGILTTSTDLGARPLWHIRGQVIKTGLPFALCDRLLSSDVGQKQMIRDSIDFCILHELKIRAQDATAPAPKFENTFPSATSRTTNAQGDTFSISGTLIDPNIVVNADTVEVYSSGTTPESGLNELLHWEKHRLQAELRALLADGNLRRGKWTTREKVLQQDLWKIAGSGTTTLYEYEAQLTDGVRNQGSKLYHLRHQIAILESKLSEVIRDSNQGLGHSTTQHPPAPDGALIKLEIRAKQELLRRMKDANEEQREALDRIKMQPPGHPHGPRQRTVQVSGSHPEGGTRQRASCFELRRVQPAPGGDSWETSGVTAGSPSGQLARGNHSLRGLSSVGSAFHQTPLQLDSASVNAHIETHEDEVIALQAQIGKALIKVDDWKKHDAARETWFTDERKALVAGHNSQAQTMYAKYKKKEMVYEREKSTLEDHLTDLGRELKARSLGYSLGGNPARQQMVLDRLTADLEAEEDFQRQLNLQLATIGASR